MKKTKIITMYLPQYHQIPENDKFWGKGFTDWTTVRNAVPLFSGHIQPKTPENNNYYDLSEEQNVIWQAQLAKTNGIYGFGVYHYWFNNDKNLLTKPAEIIRDSKNVNINYFLAWDNANWVRSWSNVKGNAWAPIAEKKMDTKKEPTIMLPYILGSEEDWKIHYSYLKKHFLSPKYIKVNNKPIFIIFNYTPKISLMCQYWDELAKKDGFDGVYAILKNAVGFNIPEEFPKFKYEPLFSGWPKRTLRDKIQNKLSKFFGVRVKADKYDYDYVWRNILKNAEKDISQNIYHGGFVAYDDTPRRGNKGKVVTGSTHQKFAYYLSQLLKISSAQDKEFVFITAWNEWGEGAYLEPDTINGIKYLEAISEVTNYIKL